jgi:hypothetical protein
MYNNPLLDNGFDRKAMPKSKESFSISFQGITILFLTAVSPVSSLCHQPLTTPKENSVLKFSNKFHSLSSMRQDNSRLLYAQSDNRDCISIQSKRSLTAVSAKTRISKWWGTFTLVIDEDQNQKNVDDYLEFLDKRYQRLYHDEETLTLSKTTKQLPILSWLIDGPHKNDFSDTQPIQDDALLLLGLSNLASSRLLHKHHQPMTKAITTQLLPEGVNETILDTKSPQPSHQSIVSHSMSSVWNKVRSARRDLVKFQEMQVKRFLKSILKVVVSIPSHVANYAKALWNYMGVKNTVVLSLSMISACLFILRPVTAVLIHLFFDSAFTES